MSIVADESVDFGIITELRSKKIRVISILEDFQGTEDNEVLNIANNKGNLLITEDKDFGELVFRLRLEHNGILLIRLNDLPRQERIKLSVRTIETYFDKLTNNFSVLTTKNLRIKTVRRN